MRALLLKAFIGKALKNRRTTSDPHIVYNSIPKPGIEPSSVFYNSILTVQKLDSTLR